LLNVGNLNSFVEVDFFKSKFSYFIFLDRAESLATEAELSLGGKEGIVKLSKEK